LSLMLAPLCVMTLSLAFARGGSEFQEPAKSGSSQGAQAGQKPNPSAGDKQGAKTPKKADQERPRPPIPTDQREGRAVRLSLSDCLGLSSRQNPDLRVTKLLELISAEDIGVQEAVFEPEMFLEGSWQRSKTPERSTFQPSVTSDVYLVRGGVRRRFETGGVLELAFNPSYFKQTVQSAFAFPTTGFRGTFSVDLDQPLLRGAWSDYWLADIERSRLEQIARVEDTARAHQEVYDSVVSAYFDLVFAREDWVVKFESLEISKEQLANTNKRIQLGELADRDRVADEADVARKEEALIAAENAILDAEDNLKRQILPFDEVEDWNLILLPTTKLGEGDPKFAVPVFRDALAAARKERPDLVAKSLRVQQAKLSLDKADRDLLPQLDFGATYSADAQTDNFNSLQSEIYRSLYPDYSLRLTLTVPIGNLGARSNYRRAKLDLERQRRELRLLEIDIEMQLRASLRALETLAKTIVSARESVKLAQNDLETEQIKLSLDSSTLFDVQQRAQLLTDARSRLLRARLDYRAAWYHLLAVQGLLTERSALAEPENVDGR